MTDILIDDCIKCCCILQNKRWKQYYFSGIVCWCYAFKSTSPPLQLWVFLRRSIAIVWRTAVTSSFWQRAGWWTSAVPWDTPRSSWATLLPTRYDWWRAASRLHKAGRQSFHLHQCVGDEEQLVHLLPSCFRHALCRCWLRSSCGKTQQSILWEFTFSPRRSEIHF